MADQHRVYGHAAHDDRDDDFDGLDLIARTLSDAVGSGLNDPVAWDDILGKIYGVRTQTLDAMPEGEIKKAARIRLDVCYEVAYYNRVSCQTRSIAQECFRHFRALERDGGAQRDPIDDADVPSFFHTASVTAVETDKKDRTKFTELLVYLQHCIRTRGLRRRGDNLYERVKTRAGVDTAAWRDVGPIEAFMHEQCRKQVNARIWSIAAQPNDPIAAAARYFQQSADPDCPEIVRVKSLFSFENGLYDSETNEFTEYPSADSDSRAPAKHFAGVDFDRELWRATKEDRSAWRNVPTDAVHSLFTYQDIEGDAIDWMYITVGRLMQELGKHDNFGYVGMIVGAAGTGKSTFCLHLAKLWEPDDVGVLSNNCERQWAIGAFVDKFLIIAPEIKSDLRLDQAEWQGMTTGDPMSVARKHRDPRTVKWKVPAFFAGNQTPDWVDHGGSVLRRILLWRFEKKVRREDGGLPAKLEEELPNFILKCAAAYLERVQINREIFGACANLWETVPDYFREQRKRLTVALNPLEGFIAEKVVVGPGLNVPFDTFKTQLRTYCSENNFKKYTLQSDNFKTVFADYDFDLKDIHYQGDSSTSRLVSCVVGCKLRSYDLAIDQDGD